LEGGFSVRVSDATVAEQMKTLLGGAVDVVTEEDLAAKIKRSKELDVPLRVKLGLDPSAPDIHLGHTVQLRKLRQFQEFGHEVYAVIGDFTGRIGDPSGKSATRPQLSEAEVRANARTYEEQVFKVLLPERAHIVFNNDWLGRLLFADVIRLASTYTVARMLERDEFSARCAEGRPIYVHEFMYPLAQAYDSVALKADVELGGTDQTFNLVAARDVMRSYALEPQVAMTMPLLVGTDGVEKMSKSLGNYIGVSDSPDEMYGRTMSVPDALIAGYFRLCTDAPVSRVDEIEAGLRDGKANPRDLKMELAFRLVEMYHGPDAAASAQEEFVRVFRRHEVPEETPEYQLPAAEMPDGVIWSVRLLSLSGLAAGTSEARRLLRQGAVRLDGEKIEEQQDLRPQDGAILQIGRRRFVRLRVGRQVPGDGAPGRSD
jgi:tyrosyl-tRNA synthetase